MSGQELTAQAARRVLAAARPGLRAAGIVHLTFSGPCGWDETIHIGVQTLVDRREDVHPVLSFRAGVAVRDSQAVVSVAVLDESVRVVVAEALSRCRLGERVALDIDHVESGRAGREPVWPPGLVADGVRAAMALLVETLAELDELAGLDAGAGEPHAG